MPRWCVHVALAWLPAMLVDSETAPSVTPISLAVSLCFQPACLSEETPLPRSSHQSANPPVLPSLLLSALDFQTLAFSHMVNSTNTISYRYIRVQDSAWDFFEKVA